MPAITAAGHPCAELIAFPHCSVHLRNELPSVTQGESGRVGRPPDHQSGAPKVCQDGLGPAVPSADTGCDIGDRRWFVEVEIHQDRYLAGFETGRSRQILLHVVGRDPQGVNEASVIRRWGLCHYGDDTDLTSWSQVELAKIRPGRSELGACAQTCESFGCLGPATEATADSRAR